MGILEKIRAPAFPTPESLSPELSAASQKLAELRDELRSVNERRKALLQVVQTGQALPPSDDLARRAAIRAGIAPPPTNESTRAALGHLNDDAQEIEAAIFIAEEIERTARSRASVAVCDQMRPRHDELARELFRAAKDFHAAWSAYGDLLRQFRQRGIAHGALQANMPDFAGPSADNRSSDFCSWMRDFVRNGVATRAELPRPYR